LPFTMPPNLSKPHILFYSVLLLSVFGEIAKTDACLVSSIVLQELPRGPSTREFSCGGRRPGFWLGSCHTSHLRSLLSNDCVLIVSLFCYPCGE
jgi:hypothetical protein